MAKQTAKKTSQKNTAAKSGEQENSSAPSSSEESMGKLHKLMTAVIVLIGIQLVLMVALLITASTGGGGMDTSTSDTLNSIDNKVSAIDTFFSNNVQGYQSGAQQGDTAAQPENPQQQGQSGSGTTGNVDVSTDDDPSWGNPDAAVTVIEFSDYQCPFCRRYWSDTYQQLKEDYQGTGEIQYVFRDFPLTNIHPQAIPAAVAANCVREQGGDDLYFEMHDKIFSEQAEQSSGRTVSFTRDDLRTWAQEIGADMEQYDSCMENDYSTQESEVRADQEAGVTAGVSGTPTIFINGEKLVGAQPYSAVKQKIEDALNNQ